MSVYRIESLSKVNFQNNVTITFRIILRIHAPVNRHKTQDYVIRNYPNALAATHGSWWHGSCAGLSPDEVSWLGKESNPLWLCNSCLDDDVFHHKTEAMFTSLLEYFDTTISSTISDVLPKVIQDSLPKTLTDDVKKAVNNSISFSVIEKKQPKQPVVYSTPGLQFVNTGVREENFIFLQQIEQDSNKVERTKHMGLHPVGNVISIKRLGRSMDPENKEKRLRHPLLMTPYNHHFFNRCFASCHHVQNFDIPVYIKKCLQPDERES